MRLLTIVAMLILFADVLPAQEETLFEIDGDRGGFGGPVIKVTSINGQAGVMIGGRGGWILDHSFIIGGGGYGLASEINAPAGILPQEGPLDIEFGCFGLELEYVFRSSSLIHYNVYTFIGLGVTNFVKDVGPVSRSNEQTGETASMFIVEPAVSVELNVTSWWRANAGVSYRIATGVAQVGLKNEDFTGASGTLTMKFGTF